MYYKQKVHFTIFIARLKRVTDTDCRLLLDGIAASIKTR